MASDGNKSWWIPLESNPEVLNKFSKSIGVPEEWEFTDVYGTDEALLAMVPKPVIAVMLLYPLTKNATDNQIGSVKESTDLYFIKQTIGNACGTIALVHALANNANQINFQADGYMNKFLAETKSMSPAEKASYLESNKEMGVVHEDCAQEGQTQAPPRDQAVIRHFVTFVCHNNTLYELDGRKEGPVHHGETTKGSLLEDAVKIVSKFIERDPGEVNFSMLALVKKTT